MIKLTIISICFMIIGCIITDKIEEYNVAKYDEEREQNRDMDSELITILKNYELISNEDCIYKLQKSKET